jgi:hypothetical protein
MALARTAVSEERSPSIIRVTRIGELRTTLAVASNRRTLRSIYVWSSLKHSTYGIFIEPRRVSCLCGLLLPLELITEWLEVPVKRWIMSEGTDFITQILVIVAYDGSPFIKTLL